MHPFGCINPDMDDVFKALAHSTRRSLLDKLYAQPGQSLSRLCEGTQMRRQSVSKHLALLEEAGLVSAQWAGREKHYYLNPVPIAEIAERWIDKFSARRAHALLRLKQALENPEGESS
jgi:DNA-binding transcriptional ArsR family regulator